MSAHIISMINMKGGVGKTTTSVNLAADLAINFGMKVLLIDLDPQTNSTFSLMNSDAWENWIDENGTLWDVFNVNNNFIMTGDSPEISYSIVKNVIPSISGFDLLPSHLKCVDLDSELVPKLNTDKILNKKLEPIKNEYDVIICDCPPNLSRVTQNAIYASDSYLIPIEPDFLASIGAGLLTSRIKILIEAMDTDIYLFGVLFTKVRQNETQMQRMMTNLRSEFGDKIFDTVINKAVDFAKATEKSLPVCKHSNSCLASELSREFAFEFKDRLEEFSSD